MLKVGDELKIVEEVRHSKSVKKRITIGIIQQINPHNIILKKIHKGKLTYNVSFNVGDIKDLSKHFYKKENEEWIPTQITITEHNNSELRRSKYD